MTFTRAEAEALLFEFTKSDALRKHARAVEGDIHHMSLAIEQGAEFDGRCKRPADASELNLDLDGPVAAVPQPRPVIQRPGQQVRPG